MTDMFVSTKMCQWIVSLLIVFATATTQEELDQCPGSAIPCYGNEYECFEGLCRCAPGFTQDRNKNICIKCPVVGESCTTTCCNLTMSCWYGVCRSCYDSFGNWHCSESMKQYSTISTAQIIMITFLILGIIATIVILVKLLSMKKIRPFGNRLNDGGRPSAGSLQAIVEERLRDAPPRYSVELNSTAVSANAYANTSFVPDYPVPRTPPPQYTESMKPDHVQNTTLHI